MNRLFIHHPLFRLLGPLFSGTLVYVMILMIQNNVEQLLDQFLGIELYFCIGLSYLIQEFSRLSLVLFAYLTVPRSSLWRLILQVLVSLILCFFLVTAAIHTFYLYVLGFTPNLTELFIFNSIFGCFTLIYIALFLSHQFLFRINTQKLEEEQIAKEGIEADFRQFKRGINPDLLFDSFEALIVASHHDLDRANSLIDHLSLVYRYILSGKKRELVPIQREIEIATYLVALFNHLPCRNIKLEVMNIQGGLIVPGTLLFIIERIIRSTIVSGEVPLHIRLFSEEKNYLIEYVPYEKINDPFTVAALEDVQVSYDVYSEEKIILEHLEGKIRMYIPQLILQDNTLSTH